MSARTRQDWILWGALGCALVGTAHSEWSLAVATGAHPWVALAVPGALDLYVIRALQMRRDVFVAVLAMVAVNVAWYLVHSGDVPVTWALRSAVAAIAPLVVWRVHALGRTRNRTELLWDTEAGAVDAPVEYTAPEPAPVLPSAPAWVPGYHLDGCDGLHSQEGPDECTARVRVLDSIAEAFDVPPHLASAHPSSYSYPSAPEYVPEEWSAHPDTSNVVHLRRRTDPSAPASAHSLQDGDEVYVPGAVEYIDNCALTGTEPSVRGLKTALKIGQVRAKRILDHLLDEPEEGEDS